MCCLGTWLLTSLMGINHHGLTPGINFRLKEDKTVRFSPFIVNPTVSARKTNEIPAKVGFFYSIIFRVKADCRIEKGIVDQRYGR